MEKVGEKQNMKSVSVPKGMVTGSLLKKCRNKSNHRLFSTSNLKKKAEASET